MQLQLIFTIIFMGICCSSFAQLQWVAFSDLNDSLNKEPKPILIFIHTDWCKICKMQENAVFEKKSVAALLNEKVYALKLDAESKESIYFLGKNYMGSNANNYHELAIFLGAKDGKLSFPNTVLLDKNLHPKFISSAYLDKESLIKMISCE